MLLPHNYNSYLTRVLKTFTAASPTNRFEAHGVICTLIFFLMRDFLICPLVFQIMIIMPVIKQHNILQTFFVLTFIPQSTK